jgi:hypothetical protein
MDSVYHVTLGFFSGHLLLVVLVVSCLWLYAAYLDLAKGKGLPAFAWQAARALFSLQDLRLRRYTRRSGRVWFYTWLP